MSVIRPEDKEKFVRAIKDVRGVMAMDSKHLTSGLVEIGQRMPPPVKAGLVGAVVGVAGAVLLKKSYVKSGLLVGGLFVLGSLMIDRASISASTISSKEKA